MKNNIILLLILIPTFLFSQSKGFNINLGIGNSVENYKALSNISTLDNPSFNLDLGYDFGKFGIVVGFTQIEYPKSFSELDNLNIAIPKLESGGDFKNLIRGFDIGPKLTLGSGKLNFDFSPRIGFGDLELGRVSSNIVDEVSGAQFSVYEVDRENKSNIYTSFNTKANFSITPNVSTSIQVKYITNRIIKPETSIETYIDPTDYNNDGELSFEELQNSPVYEKQCGKIDPIYIGLNLTFKFPSKKNKEKDNNVEIFPPICLYPEEGSSLSIAQADSLVFDWKPELEKLKGTNYILSLYKIIDSKDSLIFTEIVKKSTEYNHTDEKSLIEGKYKWIVQAIDAKDIGLCKEGCYSIVSNFNVGGFFLPQFYHLGVKNAGNYMPITNKLRFIVNPSLLFSESLIAEIVDEKQTVILSVNDILTDKEIIRRERSDRFELDISDLIPDKYYWLKVYSSDRNCYLRFHTIKLDKEENDK